MIDLHTHSTASDGSLTPEGLVMLGKELGGEALALTDHDTVEGLEAALMAGEKWAFEVVPGLEISAQYAKGTMHILGYFMDHQNPLLAGKLKTLQEARARRNPEIVRKLNALGCAVTMEDVKAASGDGQIGRPHIAMALKKKRYVKSLEEAFQRFLKKGGAAYVEKFRFSPEEAIQMIQAAKGIAVLAHPFTLNLTTTEDLKKLLISLKAEGLKGLEVYYSEHSAEQTKIFASLAGKLDLLMTRGTDFHGQNKESVHLFKGFGNIQIPYTILETLKAARPQ